MITDMTEGAPAKILWKFTMPMLLSMVFQQLYNIADSVVAGKFAGVDALAAVGASYPITMIFLAVASGSNIGCSVMISQLFGAKEYGRMKTAISTSLISAMSLSLLLTLVGFLTGKPLLRLLNTPGNILADAELYLNIYIGGLAFLFLYNICTGIFTALGDSKTPLYFLIGSSVANIIMDLIFVICFHMGVGGVAWATFLCQGVASILAFLALLRRLRTFEETEYRRFSGRMLLNISLIAIPSILQQSFISVGNLFVQGLVNSYGSDVLAGYSAAIKLNTFATMGISTLGNGLSSYTAQNIGGGKQERVKEGYKASMLMMLCVVIPFTLVYLLFGPQMMNLFLDRDAGVQAIAAGTMFLRIVSPFYLVVAVKMMADGVLRGSGAMVAFAVTTFTDLILRVILAFVLSPIFQTDGIWMSWPIGWLISAALSLVFYLSGFWKRAPVAAAEA